MAGYYAENIVSVHLNYLEYGKAAVLLYETLCKADYLSHIVMSVKWNMKELGTDENLRLSYSNQHEPVFEPSAAFYRDDELNDMMCLEKLCAILSSEDRMILKGLLNGENSTSLAMKHYLTPSTVKYRLKRMVTASGLEDKTELLDLIQKYDLHF